MSETNDFMNETNSVDIAPILDLITPRDLSVPIKGMHTGIAWDLDIRWVTREDDGHA